MVRVWFGLTELPKQAARLMWIIVRLRVTVRVRIRVRVRVGVGVRVCVRVPKLNCLPG